jgi:hypothetical protein
MTTPKEVLRKAADIMAVRGKATGRYEDPKTHAVCAYGAMALAATDGRHSCLTDANTHAYALIGQAARVLAETSLGLELGTDPFFSITGYNDADTTSAEDMILALKRAGGG